MPQETKSQAFHRLAQARKEALLDKIRLFGQLSGPSYDWTQEEVYAYFQEIALGCEEAFKRFQEQRRWAGERIGAQASAEAEDPESLAEPEPEEPSPTPISKWDRRSRTISGLIRAAQNDTELLPELLVLHKEVIDFQEAVINELQTRLPKTVS